MSTDTSTDQQIQFVELLARSNFSFLQGASHPEEMVNRAIELGYEGLALCDLNGFYGVVRAFQAAEKPSHFNAEGIAQTILQEERKTPFRFLTGVELTPHDASPVALLPMNKEGYSRLSRLITKTKRPAPKGYISLSLQDILDNNEDLLIFPLPPWNENEIIILQKHFADRLYLPVYKDFTWQSLELKKQAFKFERDLGIALFATQRPLYHISARKSLHDVLTCILHSCKLEDAALKLSSNRERYLHPLPYLVDLWKERPDLLHRSAEIANRIAFSLTELRYRYPQEVLPAGKTSASYLRELVEQGLQWRYPQGAGQLERAQVEKELALIHELEYEDYFLTLWDICCFARKQQILCQGRGSAANSIICFVLGITSVDPVKLKLLFERFISRERNEPPDIDVDFEHERREEVIQYIYQKYGAEHAAMVCTTICYRSRLAVREVAKVFGVKPDDITRLVKFMGREGLRRLLSEDSSKAPSLQFGPRLSQKKLQLIVECAREMQGFPRHLGIHSGGFVVSQDPIINIVPVEKASMDQRYVIQWNKDDINTLGLMKIDVLSLGMLTTLRKTLSILQEHKNTHIALADLPVDDRASLEMACKADTVGVFQIESRAQMALLPRLKPKKFYDLVVEVAIVRPGPIQGGMVHPYLRRREGLEKVQYADPKLIPFLEKTLGIPLFQEQVMQVAITAAGFTPGEADELRRIMSSHWNKTQVMDGLRNRLIDGMLANGIGLPFAEQIYRTIQGFSAYGFPESHAISFALLTYASLYFKCHYPDAFVCALLNSQPMGFYSPRSLIADAQRHGVEFLPLDIQQSKWDYDLEGSPHKIRVGFRSVTGLQKINVDKLVEEREKQGPFTDLTQLLKRSGLSKSVLMRLAASGALQSLLPDVRETLWALQGATFDKQSLFYGHSSRAETQVALPQESDWSGLQREYQLQGFSLDRHPLGLLRSQLAKQKPCFVMAKDFAKGRDQSRIRVAGLLSMLQKPGTAKGFCFLSMEDETGLFNVILPPQVYEKYRLLVLHHPLLCIEGTLQNRSGSQSIKAESLSALMPEEALQSRATQVRLHGQAHSAR